MINTSLAFRKIDKNSYHFFNGTVFNKKAYLVNEKEKQEIERLYLNCCLKTLGLMGFGSIGFIGYGRKPWWCFVCLGIIVFYSLFKLKMDIRNIVNNNKIVFVRPLGFHNNISKIFL